MRNFAPRLGAIWTPERRLATSVRAAWGIFYDTPHLFFNTRFANNPPWGAQITIPNPAGGFSDPYQGYPGGNPFPALEHNWATAAVPGVRRLRQRAARHGAAATAAVERQRAAAGFGEWLCGGQLPRQPHRQPVAGDRAQPGRADCRARRPATPTSAGCSSCRTRSRARSTARSAHVDDTGRGNYHGLLLTAAAAAGQQPQRAVELDDLQVHVAIRRPARSPARPSSNPNNPDLDYALLLVGPPPRREPVGGGADARVHGGVTRALFSDWQVSPIIRWQSGNRSSVTTGVDNALTGMGGPARRCRCSTIPTATARPSNYLNRAAFASPATGTYSDLEPFTDRQPVSSFQNDLAITRSFRPGRDARCSSAGRSSTSSTT